MREFAFTNGLRRLFSFAAIAALSFALLLLSGCCHSCHCNKCHSSGCSTCNACGTVSDNGPAGNSTCAACSACTTGTCSTCNTGGQYDRVGNAPPTLSEPMATPAQPTAYSTAPAYSTASNYSNTNASLERQGESRDLPVFSPVAPAPAQVSPAYAPPPQQPAGALVQDAPIHGGGQYHTLLQGETVYALSRRYGVKAKTILEANHFSDPNHLAVGTKVYIPAN